MFEGPLAEPLFMLGSRAVLVGEVALAAAVVLGVLLVVTLMALRKAARAGLEAELIAAERTEVLEDRIGELLRVQSETSGRLQTMAEVLGSRQSDLARLVGERLDGLGHRLGQSMAETTKSTHANLTQLNERLAVIDRAQDTIAKLSGHVVALEKIFADKQTRGAFGQGRMEAIVRDALPTGAYEFQATLSNGTRPDCLVRLSNGQPPLAIDAKFNVDDNGLFRHKDIQALFDPSEENPAEMRASRMGLSYIALDGNIGCLVNGAGLAMATMDTIKLHGGEPANFLDVGGGASEEAVTEAFSIILSDAAVKGILVNIFGGIMDCAVIAQGIVNAAKSIGFKVPLVVRLEGTNVQAGREILKKAAGDLPTLQAASDLGDAAAKVVGAVG